MQDNNKGTGSHKSLRKAAIQEQFQPPFAETGNHSIHRKLRQESLPSPSKNWGTL
jgi:hypothetical protein